MGAKAWFERLLDKAPFRISRQRGGYNGRHIFRCDVLSGIEEALGSTLLCGYPCSVWPDCNLSSRYRSKCTMLYDTAVLCLIWTRAMCNCLSSRGHACSIAANY